MQRKLLQTGGWKREAEHNLNIYSLQAPRFTRLEMAAIALPYNGRYENQVFNNSLRQNFGVSAYK